MKTKTSIVLSILIIFLNSVSFCQDNMSETNTVHKNDFLEKALKTLEIDKKFAESFYEHEININEHKKFKKMGIDLKELAYKLAGGKNYKENALESDFVILGTVVKVEYDSTVYDTVKKTYYPLFGSTFSIHVDEILLGNDKYKLQDTIYIMRQTGLYVGSSIDTVPLDLEKQYIFFLTRNHLKILYTALKSMDIENVFKNYGAHTFPTNSKLENKMVFVEKAYSTLGVKSSFVYKNDKKLEPNLKSLKKTIKQIEKINDRGNFYIREYN